MSLIGCSPFGRISRSSHPCYASKMSDLVVLKQRIPWLALIPVSILNRLCLDEFKLPSSGVMAQIHNLERVLDCYIMPYSGHVFRRDLLPEFHLCANIGWASLSPEQLKKLQRLERNLRPHDISLAAYARPLRLVTPARLPDGLGWSGASS